MKKTFLKAIVQKSDKKSEDGGEIFSIIASTAAIDRQGDSVDQAGWELGNFKQNPVLLWAHDYQELPIGKVVSAEVVDGKLVAEFVFAPEEANPKAQQVKNLYEGGYLNASSVGFIPLERQGHIITRAELLELSLVPVPANQEAIRLAISKGFDISAIEKDLQKGEVADVMDVREAYEMKWENWEKIGDVMSALWSVYFNEETPVEDFQKLLDEAIVILQKVARGEETTEEEKGIVAKAMGPDAALKFATAMKAGKVLSKKNLELIDGACASMKEAIKGLEELTASVKETEEEKVVETVEIKHEADASKEGGAEGEVVTLSVVDMMEIFQTSLRGNAKANESTLAIVNGFLSKQKSKAA